MPSRRRRGVLIVQTRRHWGAVGLRLELSPRTPLRPSRQETRRSRPTRGEAVLGCLRRSHVPPGNVRVCLDRSTGRPVAGPCGAAVHIQLGRVLHVLWRLVRASIRPFPLPDPADLRSNYLADAYETYSSSAQAAQSFARNIFSGVFPLFAHQMVSTLTNPVTRSDTDSSATVHRHGLPTGIHPRRIRRTRPRRRADPADTVRQDAPREEQSRERIGGDVSMMAAV